MGREKGRSVRAARWLLMVAVAVSTTLPASAQQATPVASPIPSDAKLYTIPGDAVFPEGIAYDPKTDRFFVGSTGNGAIYRGDRKTGKVTALTPGSGGIPVAGMKVDAEGRLYVAGLQSGIVFVYDSETGDLLASYHTGRTGKAFLNDLAVAPNGDVWVTDSLNPLLYVVPAGSVPQRGTSTDQPVKPDADNMTVGVDMTGTAFPMGPGFNANGIVVTPDGRYALVAHAATGTLYRVDLGRKTVNRIDLGGVELFGADGMLLDDHTLYVVHQGIVSPVELNLDYRRGAVGDPITDGAFNSPTTIAEVGDCLLVVNSQFRNREKGPQLPFTVAEIPLPGSADGRRPGEASC